MKAFVHKYAAGERRYLVKRSRKYLVIDLEEELGEDVLLHVTARRDTININVGGVHTSKVCLNAQASNSFDIVLVPTQERPKKRKKKRQ